MKLIEAVKNQVGSLSPEKIKLISIVALFSLFVFLRLLPHPSNFTPIGAVAFASGLWFFRKSWLFLIPVSLILVTDLYYGLYDGIVFTYLAYALIFTLGALFDAFSVKGKFLKGFYFLLMNVSASVIFFFISNLGVWWSTSMYTRDLQGLVECFILAIPFYPMSLLSQLFYVVILQVCVYSVYFVFRKGLLSAKSEEGIAI